MSATELKALVVIALLVRLWSFGKGDFYDNKDALFDLHRELVIAHTLSEYN